jgi:hypothetical protein
MNESLAARFLPATALHGREVGASSPGEVTLCQEGGVLVTSERVVADGRSQPLAEVVRVESVRRSPRLKPVLVTLALFAAVVLPAQAVLLAGTAYSEGGLVLAGLVIFGCIARLVLAEETHQVVLHTRHGAWRVLSARESAHTTRLAGVIHEAASTARRRR